MKGDRGGTSASTGTERMTSWASNSSNGSSMKSGASSRLASGYLGGVGGGGWGVGGAFGRETAVEESPASSVTSDKVCAIRQGRSVIAAQQHH